MKQQRIYTVKDKNKRRVLVVHAKLAPRPITDEYHQKTQQNKGFLEHVDGSPRARLVSNVYGWAR